MRSASEWSRREFLGAVASTVAVHACTRAPYRTADFTVPDRSAMCVLPAADYGADFSDLIGRGLRELAVDVRRRRVLLKPNMVEYESGSAINTHPAVVAGAAHACLRAGAQEVLVAEGPGHRRDTEYLLWGSGLGDILKDLRIRFVDLNLSDVRSVPLRSRFMQVRELWLPTEILEADVVISMPKLKTHHWVGLTASMKNLFGIVPGGIYGWPKNFLHERGIENAILDLNATIRTGLTIVDGVVGMEGDGPIMGRPKAMGFVALGTDPVAVDATCAHLIGLDPRRVGYIAASQFLGNVDAARIEQRGEAVDRYRTRFDIPPRLQLLQATA
jgi:uncharacterized protein (DUF362 family)